MDINRLRSDIDKFRDRTSETERRKGVVEDTANGEGLRALQQQVKVLHARAEDAETAIGIIMLESWGYRKELKVLPLRNLQKNLYGTLFPQSTYASVLLWRGRTESQLKPSHQGLLPAPSS